MFASMHASLGALPFNAAAIFALCSGLLGFRMFSLCSSDLGLPLRALDNFLRVFLLTTRGMIILPGRSVRSL